MGKIDDYIDAARTFEFTHKDADGDKHLIRVKDVTESEYSTMFEDTKNITEAEQVAYWKTIIVDIDGFTDFDRLAKHFFDDVGVATQLFFLRKRSTAGNNIPKKRSR